MNLFERLDAARASCNVLEHSFYVRWSAGELEPAELARYSGQYRHAVVALAEAATAAARAADVDLRPELERHAREEWGHVRLWDGFLEAAGGSAADQPLPGTADCAGAWTAGSDLLERLAVLYAVEASQPEISRTKLAGLVTHYGQRAATPATEYFELHAQLDELHAAQSRRLLEALAGEADEDRLVKGAEAALRGNWRLLDAVEELSAAPH
jgi:pyrroloquinoline-quinone synthase